MTAEDLHARRSLLEILVGDNADSECIGRRALVLAYLLRCPSMRGKKQSDLAKQVGTSEAAISKRVKSLRRIFALSKPDRDAAGFEG
jgi:DNA-binding MarR family transcriptional regulator